MARRDLTLSYQKHLTAFQMKQDDRFKTRGHKDNLFLNYLVPASPEELGIWENHQCHCSQEFPLLIKSSSSFSDQTKTHFVVWHAEANPLSQKTTFEWTLNWLHPYTRKCPNMTCVLPVTGLIKFPASQLELHHPLSNSAGNSMAITLNWLKSQSVCTHSGTVTLSAQIPAALQKSNDK